ncbi:hypothetical protein [Dactylosporangium matsuzakiense]|uniref:Uncharacterized protein n=1 Tax=Dactylosporangium matsuzakiense TaxID=53360 RepID=A0A9W6KM43_9ACTN|nr:hypothetical protein [Dactylosporangium matsuzakiense]GLL02781.1 hypothetical protein GCM10017581_045230 [Dactylosporangium matsuzakiense]
MGNVFTADGSSWAHRLELSNGATDVFFDVLTLAGCAIADTPWERHLVLFFTDAHRWSRGTAGFDLGELPWTTGWLVEKAFLDRLIGMALHRHGWDRLAYDPPNAIAYLSTFREMIAGYTPTPVSAPAWGDWRVSPDPALTARCQIHGVFVGEFGCRLCDPNLQPR